MTLFYYPPKPGPGGAPYPWGSPETWMEPVGGGGRLPPVPRSWDAGRTLQEEGRSFGTVTCPVTVSRVLRVLARLLQILTHRGKTVATRRGGRAALPRPPR